MAELVFIMVFRTYMCRKMLTKLQKFNELNDFRHAPVLFDHFIISD